jgi:hypothetical protein
MQNWLSGNKKRVEQAFQACVYAQPFGQGLSP